MIVRSELYFPDIDFELPDPPVPASEEHQIFAQKLKAKLARDSKDKHKDPSPPTVRYSESPLWTWPEVLRDVDSRLGSLRDRYGVRLPMERVDIEMVRRSSLIPKKGKQRKQLVSTYGEDSVDAIIGLHTRSSDGMHRIRMGYYGEQYSKTSAQVKRTLTHELGHVLGEDALLVIEYEELKGYTLQSLLMGEAEKAAGSTGSVVHDNSKRMLVQLGGMGICEPAILAHLTGISFGEYKPQSYRDLRRF